MDYNLYYKTNADVFGKTPEKILVDYAKLISKECPVLDIGAGQGRNTIYLSKLGYEVDAIDPSSVSINLMKEIKKAEKLNFNTFNTDFKNFTSNKNYSAVLVFGLIQILDRDEIELLKNKISSWLKKDGLLFITSFLVSDDSHERIRNESKEIGKNSYLRPDGEKRTFFEPNEIMKLFQEYKSVYYWEGLGPEHRHGNRPVEKHALVGAVFQKLD
jgi:tellurite methyltransferase